MAWMFFSGLESLRQVIDADGTVLLSLLLLLLLELVLLLERLLLERLLLLEPLLLLLLLLLESLLGELPRLRERHRLNWEWREGTVGRLHDLQRRIHGGLARELRVRMHRLSLRHHGLVRGELIHVSRLDRLGV